MLKAIVLLLQSGRLEQQSVSNRAHLVESRFQGGENILRQTPVTRIPSCVSHKLPSWYKYARHDSRREDMAGRVQLGLSTLKDIHRLPSRCKVG